MATRIKGVKANTTGDQIINQVRAMIIADGDLEYGQRIPEATQDNLKDVGKALFDYKVGMNEFIDTLINRIGMVIVKRRNYQNKLRSLKRGFLEYGDSIQEIMTDIAKAFEYTPDVPVNNPGDVFEQVKPKVLEAFHKVNRENYYKVTINEAMLKRAFVSYADFDSFVASVFDSLYNADEWDEYLLFTHLLGSVASETYQVSVVKPTDKTTSEAFSIQLRSQALSLEYMSRKYNQAGVATHTPLSEQILILRSDIVPVIDVTQLANQFNLSFGQPLSGRVIVIDSFGEENDNVLGMIIDADFSMIYDTRYETTSIYNPQHLYWNYFLHHHQIISSSPFSNSIALVTGSITNTINSVTLMPSVATVMKGTYQQFEAVVDYNGSPDTSVTYTVKAPTPTSGDAIALSSGTKISNTGLLQVGIDEANTSVIVTATSTANTAKNSSVTVTLVPYEVAPANSNE